MITNKKILIAGIVLLVLAIALPNLVSYYKTEPQRERFIKETDYNTYLENKMQTFRKSLLEIKKMDEPELQNRKLVFNFNTNNMEKVMLLENEIRKNYYPSVRHGGDVPHPVLFLITGETNRMTISDTLVEAWVKQMCKVGFQFDCEFMSWGLESEVDK